MNFHTGASSFDHPTATSIVQHSWWLFKSRALAFFALALAAYLPLFLFTIWSIPLTGHGLARLALGLGIAVMMTVFEAVMVYSARNAVEGVDESPRQMVGAVFSRLGPLLVLGFLVGLGTYVLNIAANSLINLFITPGIKVYIFTAMAISTLLGSVFAAAVPICLIEKRGGLSSLTESLALVKNHLKTVLLLVAGLNLLDYLRHYLIEIFLAGPIQDEFAVFHILTLLTTALFLAIQCVMFTVVYYDLSDWRDHGGRARGLFNPQPGRALD